MCLTIEKWVGGENTKGKFSLEADPCFGAWGTLLWYWRSSLAMFLIRSISILFPTCFIIWGALGTFSCISFFFFLFPSNAYDTIFSLLSFFFFSSFLISLTSLVILYVPFSLSKVVNSTWVLSSTIPTGLKNQCGTIWVIDDNTHVESTIVDK